MSKETTQRKDETMMTSHKKPRMRKTRKARVCHICDKRIGAGEQYGQTVRGTAYCAKCK